MKTEITLGHCPDGGQQIYLTPFDEVFDLQVNLKFKTNLENIDGVVLWGGEDISPTLYKQEPVIGGGPINPTERDIFEWDILRKAVAKKIPIIGVCRGAQMVCAFAGGKLVQHTSGHGMSHTITMVDTGEIFKVTSSHHQMMWPYDVKHEMLAVSTQRLSNVYFGLTDSERERIMKREVPEPEVVYFPEINALAIQPHPEWSGNDKKFIDFITNFVCDRMFQHEEC
jgi:anthranilate/para-aminobenzoate synthase component II